MDSSTKNALFVIGVVLSIIVVAFVSLLIGSMIFAEPKEFIPTPAEVFTDDYGVVYELKTPPGEYELLDASDLEDDEYEIPGTINDIPVSKISEDAFKNNKNLKKITIKTEDIIENADKIPQDVDVYVWTKLVPAYKEVLLENNVYSFEETIISDYVDEFGVVYKLKLPSQEYELFNAQNLEELEYNVPQNINGISVTSISNDAFNESLQKLKIRSPEIIENIENTPDDVEIYVLPRNFQTYQNFLEDREIYPLYDDADIIDEENCVTNANVYERYYQDAQGIIYELHRSGDLDYDIRRFGEAYWSVYDINFDYFNENKFSTIKFLSGINGIPVKAIWKHFDCVLDYVEELIIPRNIIAISVEEGVFSSWPKLSKITVQEGNPMFDSRGNCNAICDCLDRLLFGCKTTIIPQNIKEIDHKAFYHCSGLTSIIIPNSVTVVDSSAFNGCQALNSVNGLNSVQIIEEHAFYGCVNLKSINLTNSITKILRYAFGDTGLTSVTIPSSIIEIGNGAFSGDNLRSFSGGNSNYLVSSDHRCLIKVDGTTKELISFAGNGLVDYTIPEDITNIDGYCFGGGINLTIPITVVGINGSFDGCNSVKLLGRKEFYFDYNYAINYQILVSRTDLAWYCDQWGLSTNSSDENYYAKYNVSTYN